MLAGYLCARVAETATPETKAELRAHVDRMDQLVALADEDRYFEVNLAFHDHIAEASDASRARALYVSLGKEVRLLRLRVLTGPFALRVSNAEHRAILAAIEIGDVETARAEGARHHLNGKERLLETL